VTSPNASANTAAPEVAVAGSWTRARKAPMLAAWFATAQSAVCNAGTATSASAARAKAKRCASAASAVCVRKPTPIATAATNAKAIDTEILSCFGG
jgi:hypothetical protein